MPDASPRHIGECPFCNRAQTNAYLLCEGENFLVVADFAPVADAHILLIPKSHYPHLAAIPPELEVEFDAMKSHIGEFVQKQYGRLTYWENGVFGQSVPHAHLHFLSVEMNTDLISQYGAPIASLSDLRAHHAENDNNYFLVEHAGVWRVMPPDAQLYWSIISDAKVRNGGTWQFSAAERRVQGRSQVQELIRRWREYHEGSLPRATS
jgi:diadenosine tetraphosphate (Ap4A) HIT family hydrolase